MLVAPKLRFGHRCPSIILHTQEKDTANTTAEIDPCEKANKGPSADQYVLSTSISSRSKITKFVCMCVAPDECCAVCKKKSRQGPLIRIREQRKRQPNNRFKPPRSVVFRDGANKPAIRPFFNSSTKPTAFPSNFVPPSNNHLSKECENHLEYVISSTKVFLNDSNKGRDALNVLKEPHQMSHAGTAARAQLTETGQPVFNYQRAFQSSHRHSEKSQVTNSLASQRHQGLPQRISTHPGGIKHLPSFWLNNAPNHISSNEEFATGSMLGTDIRLSTNSSPKGGDKLYFHPRFSSGSQLLNVSSAPVDGSRLFHSLNHHHMGLGIPGLNSHHPVTNRSSSLFVPVAMHQLFSKTFHYSPRSRTSRGDTYFSPDREVVGAAQRQRRRTSFSPQTARPATSTTTILHTPQPGSLAALPPRRLLQSRPISQPSGQGAISPMIYRLPSSNIAGVEATKLAISNRPHSRGHRSTHITPPVDAGLV